MLSSNLVGNGIVCLGRRGRLHQRKVDCIIRIYVFRQVIDHPNLLGLILVGWSKRDFLGLVMARHSTEELVLTKVSDLLGVLQR